MATETTIALGQREPRMVRAWDRSKLPTDKLFAMPDRSVYLLHESGAFIKVNKDRRTAKARKADRRQARNAQALP